MLKNYFIVGWRNIVRYPFHSTLNILGISAGILFTLLIGAYVWGELRVNRLLSNADNQYFLTSEWKDPNMGIPITTFGPLAKRLKEDYPSLVANYYRGDYITSIVSKGEKHFRESMDIGDSTLLTMYGFKLLHGNSSTAMQKPFSVVIRKEIALKYFGKTDVVGQTINIQNFSNTSHEFIITGVLDDLPENSVTDLNIDNRHLLFIPASTYRYFPREDRENWANADIPSYIELRPGVTPKDIALPLKRLIEANTSDDIKQNVTIRPIALKTYYLYKDNALVQRLLYALVFTGVFILLMAAVNFINISVGSSSARIKEIGVRKVLGGLRKNIILQLLIESVLLVLIAAVFALILYPVASPLFSSLVGKNVAALSAFSFSYILFPAALVLLVGIAAGIYPAVVLSKMKTSESIKGKLKSAGDNAWMRKLLAGFQFCLASIVIIAAFIVTQQVTYFFGRSLGYNKEYVVSSQAPRDWTPEGIQKISDIRDQFAAMPEVLSASVSYEIPDGMNGGQALMYRADLDSTKSIAAQAMNTDEYFMETYGIPMKAGTYFSAQSATDATKVVINETAAKALGWPNARDAIGRQVKFPGFPDVCTITGITGDYHFSSMQQKIPPMVYGHIKLFNTYRYLSFKLKPGNTSNAIHAIEKKWAQLLPGSSFEYRFMDDTLKRVYKTELQLQKAAYAATLLSLLIVLIGVIGVVSLSIQKRTKEIGIRKVLGASVSNIVTLFIKDFVGVIAVAGLVACPLAWLVMHNWLNNYAYRIDITIQPFIFSVLTLAFITLVLITFQTARAGNANPVKSLKTE